MEEKECPKCNSKLSRTPDTHGLVKWEQRPDGVVQIDTTQIVPVRVWDCPGCGFIELYHESPHIRR